MGLCIDRCITEVRPASIMPGPPPFLVHMYDLLCIKGMLAETASEGDDVTRYFDSLVLEDTIALTTT